MRRLLAAALLLAPGLLLARDPHSAPPRDESLNLYVGGAKAGSLRAVDQQVEGGGWLMRREAKMSVKRGALVLELESASEAEVTAGFHPRHFRYVRRDVSGSMTVEGVFTCKPTGICAADVETTVGGVVTKRRVELGPEVTLASALEARARRDLKAGNSFKGQVLVEELGAVQPASYTVTAQGSGFLITSELAGVKSLDHLDATGRTIKSEVPALNAVATPVGTPPPDASGGKVLDVLARSTWPGPRLPKKLSRVRFLLQATDGEMGPIPEDRRQRTLRRTKDTVVVEVSAKPAGKPEVLTAEARREALAATPYEPLGDPRLVEAAREARGNAKSPREVVSAVTLWVNDHVDDKNLSRAYAPATVTLETRVGDCTEHSVLTSALLKQNGIPTRLVDGVIAFDNRIGYHEWVEAYVDGEGWLPVDPTFGEPEAGPNRVKFATGSSNPSDLMTMGLSAAQAFRGLVVKVEGFDPAP
jgi:transglutaminase-like putative cysteine protease